MRRRLIPENVAYRNFMLNKNSNVFIA
jgi:hypothetical protein